jgi:adenylate kinase family enzyme
MRRVSVVGTSGAGKTTLASELAVRIGVPHIELDALHHMADWEPRPRDELRAMVAELVGVDGWVIDGNYGNLVQDLVWARADTVVWLDPSRAAVMRRLLPRTLSRITTRRELWNGNRETFGNLFRWEPEENILRWAWTRHGPMRERYEAAMHRADHGHLSWVRLRTRHEARRWLQTQ